MSVEVAATPYGSPSGTRYDPAMAKIERMSVEDARRALGKRLDMARDDDTHTVVAKHGRDAGVIVPMDWYRRMRQLDGDPTDL